MAMQRALYHPGFPARARKLKLAAGNRCQRCGALHGEMTTNRFGAQVEVQIGVAHLDHDVWNPRARLAVLCRCCHIRYDARQRRRKRRMMAVARGQLCFWKELLYEAKPGKKNALDAVDAARRA